MGSAAFVAYLSRLCSVSFTATQYALFSALFALSGIGARPASGWLAERMEWIPFFAVAAAAGIPGLLLILWLMRQPSPEPPSGEPVTRTA
jgi:PAT family beta-lactamase induction signal transducer AmpG